jgi:hypothetical protein
MPYALSNLAALAGLTSAERQESVGLTAAVAQYASSGSRVAPSFP